MGFEVWKTIEGCWEDDPVQRKPMTEVVTILKAEMTRVTLSSVLLNSCVYHRLPRSIFHNTTRTEFLVA